jgi:3',5'-cyclic-nucleotide phosphodiesterase
VGFSVSKTGLTELGYAALLHDFGKVGVRECVLVKERRLHPEQMAAVEARLRLVAMSHESELLRRELRGEGGSTRTSSSCS